MRKGLMRGGNEITDPKCVYSILKKKEKKSHFLFEFSKRIFFCLKEIFLIIDFTIILVMASCNSVDQMMPIR